MAYATFYSSFSANIITLLSIGSIREDYYAFTNPLRHGFRPYTKACMASIFANSGNACTMLSNAVMYFCMVSYCHRSYYLSLALFLLSRGAY